VASEASEARVARRLSHLEAPERSTAPNTSGHTILVVEDSDDVRALAREHLESLGYTVQTASDADEALRILNDPGLQIDLVFTDLIMPGSMNGLGLAEALQKTWPDLPILFTTGYNEDLVTDGRLAAGMDLIGKPYRRTELADRVNAALNRPRPMSRPLPRLPGSEGHKEA
jgi:CheY-like chemotaxis protein